MSRAASMRRIWVLMATVFVDMIGFLIVLPLLPFYAERFGASDTTIGLLISAFAFAQLTSAPLWGRLSDRLGRRPVILGSLLLSAAAFVVFGLSRSVWMLFVSRFVQGLGTGTTGVVQAYVSDSVAPEQRTRALGWLSAATSAGVVLGPAIGSLSTRMSPEAPGFVAAALCLANFVFARWMLPESVDEKAGADEGAAAAAAAARPEPERSSLRQALVRVLTHPASDLSRLVWVYALGMMAFMAMNGVIVLYLEREFGVTVKNVGWFYTYVGAISLFMRAVLLGPINDWLGDVRTLRIGALSLACGLAAAPLPGTLLGLAAVIALVPVGTALLFPATSSLISRHSRRDEVGQNLGVQQGFGGVSRMLGPIWATAAFGYVSRAAPFWLSAGLVAGVFLIALGISSPRRVERPEREPVGPESGAVEPP